MYRRVHALLSLVPEENFDSPTLLPDEPTQTRRYPLAWLLLAAIFALLIASQFAQQPPEEKPTEKFAKESSAIRLTIRMRSLVKNLAKKQALPESRYEDVLETLASKKSGDPNAARLYVAARFELTGKVDAMDLALAAKDNSPDGKAFARLYGSPKLGAQEATWLTVGMEDGLATQLARVRAADIAGDPAPRKRLESPGTGLLLVAMMTFACFAGLAGLALWILYFSARSKGKFAPSGHPADPVGKTDSDRFAMRAAILLGLYTILGALLSELLSERLSQGARIAIVPTVLVLGILLMHKLPVFGAPITLRRVGLHGDNFGKNLVWGAAAYCATLPLVLLAALIGQQLVKVFGEPSHPATDLIQGGASPATVAAVFLAGSVAAPLWEEIMFRGTLLPALAALFGRPVWGVVAASLLFAALHPQGVTLWLALGTIAVMASVVTYQTKSLVPAIVLHVLNNTAVLAMNVLISA